MGAKRLGGSDGSVARGLALCRIRLGTKHACRLVSRCGHHGLSITHYNCDGPIPKTGPCPLASFQLTLTERFGQDILLAADNRPRRPFTTFPGSESFQKS